MFNWLRKSTNQSLPGLHKIRRDFLEMLEAAHREFTLATDACLAGVDVDSVRESVLATDKQINKAERDIRKDLIVHVSVQGTLVGTMSGFPECLVMMSIAKDAERLGDYAKNIFDLADISPLRGDGEDWQRMLILKKLIGKLFTSCRQVFDTEDQQAAVELIRESTWIAAQCEQNVVRLLKQETPGRLTAYYVLLYRYMKRLAAHLRNICSSVVQPVHKIDFTSKITEGMEKGGDLLDRKEGAS